MQPPPSFQGKKNFNLGSSWKLKKIQLPQMFMKGMTMLNDCSLVTQGCHCHIATYFIVEIYWLLSEVIL